MHEPQLDEALPPLPALPDAFAWRQDPWGATLICHALEPYARHGWTTRALRLEGPDESCSAQWQALAAVAEVDVASVIRPHQVHGATVALVDAAASSRQGVGAADAVATRARHVLLTIRVADCVPILLADPRTGAVAAVHAGWRGTNAAVAMRAVERMHSAFGTDAEDLVAGIGPSIGACCYQVGPEVRDAFASAGWGEMEGWFVGGAEDSNRATAHTGLHAPAGNPHLDLPRANCDQLVAAGVPRESVHMSRLCTACHGDWFYSYRRDGTGTGRLLGFIQTRSATATAE